MATVALKERPEYMWWWAPQPLSGGPTRSPLDDRSRTRPTCVTFHSRGSGRAVTSNPGLNPRGSPAPEPSERSERRVRRRRSVSELLSAQEVPARLDAAVLVAAEYRLAGVRAPVVGSVERLRYVDFRRVEPVRLPTSYQGQWSKGGDYYVSRLGISVRVESLLERYHVMVANRDPRLTHVTSQPFRLHWKDGHQIRKHTPDLLFVWEDGAREVVDVKGSARADLPYNRLIFEVTAKACARAGFGFRIARDIPPVVLNNLRWLEGYRIPPPHTDAIVPVATEVFADGPMTMAEAIETVARVSGEHPLRVKAALFHMQWAGILDCDLTIPFTSTASMTLTLAATHA